MATVRATAQVLERPLVLAEDGIREMMRLIANGHVSEETLRNTPRRVVDALFEMTDGYDENPADILACRFPAPGDDLVILKDVEFTSVCEHHMMPFNGRAHVAYIPNDFVVGISKLARVVDCFARRFQLQERLCAEIAGAILEHVSPLGAACLIEATHGCLSCRGARKQRATFISSAMLGHFRDKPELRQEFFAAINLTHSLV